MAKMTLTTAGESHGRALVAIVEGIPAHLSIKAEDINRELALRQSGFGRGGRQKIERDSVEILTGVRNGESLGSPITLCIENRDYQNWERAMSAGECDSEEMAKKAAEYRPEIEFSGISSLSSPDVYFMLFELSESKTGEKRRAIFYFDATQKLLSICRYYNPTATVLSQVSR